MEPILPEPAKLLTVWMEWEHGDTTPGKTLADLKRAGMRELLDGLALAENGAGSPTA